MENHEAGKHYVACRAAEAAIEQLQERDGQADAAAIAKEAVTAYVFTLKLINSVKLECDLDTNHGGTD